MLSKSKGQILRVAACLHVLFHIETPVIIEEDISAEAMKAAIDLVNVCIQHAAFIAGRGDVNDMIEEMEKGWYIHTFNTYIQQYCNQVHAAAIKIWDFSSRIYQTTSI